MARLSLLLVLALSLLVMAGCTQQSPDQLLQTAINAEQAVRKHHSERNPKAARKASKIGWRAALTLSSLARQSTNEVLLADAGKAMTHARAARDEAELAMDEWEYSKATNSIAARSYRRVRGPVVTGLVNKLANAADCAATNEFATLPPITRELAEAAEMVADIVDLGTHTDGNTARDWTRIASQLRSCATNQSPGFSLALACGFIGMGQGDIAIAELESVSKAQLRTKNDFLLYHGGRCLIYIVRGWTQLAGPEFQALEQRLGGKDEHVNSRAFASLYHTFLAIEAVSENDLLTLDAEMASAVSAWPENPWLAFVTGERLAADGNWEQAAESLEKEAKGTKHEWAARRMAQRARDLRDGKGNTTSLVIDAAFLSGFALDWATTAGKDTPAGKQVTQLINSSKGLASAALQKIPLVGCKESHEPAKSE